MAVSVVKRPGGMVRTHEAHWSVLPEPEGACNAERRGQTREKYIADFYRGKWGERIACLSLRRLGFTVKDPDDAFGMNKHEPDLAITTPDGGTYFLHVKTSDQFGFRSWVVQDTAIRDLPPNHYWILTSLPLKNGAWWSGRIDFACTWALGVELLKPLRNGNPSKKAIYARDLAQRCVH